jgi:RNase P subunit RPR2
MDQEPELEGLEHEMAMRGYCPKCHTSLISSTGVEETGRYAIFRDMKCLECGAAWVLRYDLSGALV